MSIPTIPYNRYKIKAGQGQWFVIYDNGTVVHESGLKDIKAYLKKNSQYSDSKIQNILDRSLTEFVPIDIKLTNESIKLRNILFESNFKFDKIKEHDTIRMKDLIIERYKFSDIVINNIPNENDSLWDKIYWTYKLLVKYIKENEPTYKKDQSIVWLIGGLKQVISGFAFQFYLKYIKDPNKKHTYQEFLKDIKSKYENESDDYGYSYYESVLKERTPNDKISLRDKAYTRYQDSTSEKVNAYKHKKEERWDDKTDGNGNPIEQIKVDKKDEHLENCYNWVTSEQMGWASKAASDPLSSFNKIFEKAKKLYKDIRRKEEMASKSKDFLDKISAQSSPRLSLADQKAVRNNKGAMSSDLYTFIFGSKGWDLSARMTLNRALDLYVYPKVPTGGRLAQTMPETLLVNYYKRMKQNVLAMGFDQTTFMNFIEKYIGFNSLHKWFKTGKVYRIGREYNEEIKRKWVPGSNSLDGIKSFTYTFNYDGGTYPKYFYTGITKYFDLYGYINYIMKELGYGEYNDSEKEILLQPNQNLNVKKLNDFNELKKEIDL